MIGETISHYRVIKKIGEGGMGVVYLAEHTLLGRRVAIKTLLVSGAENQHFRSRFLREAQAVSKLSHPNIANIYDYGETVDGQPYIVMELVEGTTLDNLMREEVVNISRAIAIVKQVAEALSEAHRSGIVHRDIKPSNIAVDERGVVKVLDFGLAKHVAAPSAIDAESTHAAAIHTQTREGVIVGTPMYLSPEQALGLDVDARSDLFSLGSVLYECIAGRPPFAGKSAIDICAKVIRDDPPPPSEFNGNIPSELDRITLKALAKQPDTRFQTAAEMIAVLEKVSGAPDGLSSNQTVTRQVNSGSRARSTSALATLSDIFRRPRLSLGYVIASVVLLTLVVVIFSRLTRATLPPPTPAAKQLYEKGLAALREGSYFKASKLFERALAIDDKFVLAHARLAEAYAELDYPDRAKDQMLSASRIVTDLSMLDRTSALSYGAIQASVTRDFTAAIKSYEELSRLNSNDDAAYQDLARAYANYDETDRAIEQYSKASSLNSANPAPLLRLGVLYGRRQDLTKSNAALDKADGLYKDDQNFEGNAEVAYQRGYLLNQISKIPEAREAAQHSLEVAKLAGNQYQEVRALLLLSAVSYSSGDTAGAQPLVTQALELARANDMEDMATQGLLDLSNASLLRQGFDDAERYARQGLDLAQRYKEKGNEARANLLLGSIYIQQEDVDKGKTFIDLALNFYKPSNYRREVSRCMILIGRSQLLKGDFDGAVKTLDDQLQLAKQVEDPGETGRSQSEVAAALGKQDLYPQAETRYNESYQIYKGLANPLRTAFALVNRGDMLTRLGRYGDAQAAMKELQSYLDLVSDDSSYKQIYGAWSHLYLARMYLSQRNIFEARSECAKALAIVKPDDNETLAEIQGTQGLIEVFGGSPGRGRALCEAAAARIRHAPLQHKGSVLLALAEAQLESGDADAALGTALESQQILASLHEPEHEWRVWLIAARANQRLGKDNLSLRDQLKHAQDLLNQLGTAWGEAAMATYDQRADIRLNRKQLEELSSKL
jgi:serine/threonine protein kinase/tetratricopeptide (TPR) repeat protein